MTVRDSSSSNQLVRTGIATTVVATSLYLGLVADISTEEVSHVQESTRASNEPSRYHVF